MWVTGKQHLIMLEFVAGIDNDENRLVIYDANMEDSDPGEFVDLECPRQIRANKGLKKILTYSDRGILPDDVECVVMEGTNGWIWHWVIVVKVPPRFIYIRAHEYSSLNSDSIWQIYSLIRRRTPALLWKRIPNRTRRTFLKMISEGMLAKKRPARERDGWRRS